MSRPMALALLLLVLFLTSQSEWRTSHPMPPSRGLRSHGLLGGGDDSGNRPAHMTRQQRLEIHRDGIKEKIILDLMADLKHLEADKRRLEADKAALQDQLQELQLRLFHSVPASAATHVPALASEAAAAGDTGDLEGGAAGRELKAGALVKDGGQVQGASDGESRPLEEGEGNNGAAEPRAESSDDESARSADSAGHAESAGVSGASHAASAMAVAVGGLTSEGGGWRGFPFFGELRGGPDPSQRSGAGEIGAGFQGFEDTEAGEHRMGQLPGKRMSEVLEQLNGMSDGRAAMSLEGKHAAEPKLPLGPLHARLFPSQEHQSEGLERARQARAGSSSAAAVHEGGPVPGLQASEGGAQSGAVSAGGEVQDAAGTGLARPYDGAADGAGAAEAAFAGENPGLEGQESVRGEKGTDLDQRLRDLELSRLFRGRTGSLGFKAGAHWLRSRAQAVLERRGQAGEGRSQGGRGQADEGRGQGAEVAAKTRGDAAMADEEAGEERQGEAAGKARGNVDEGKASQSVELLGHASATGKGNTLGLPWVKRHHQRGPWQRDLKIPIALQEAVGR